MFSSKFATLKHQYKTPHHPNKHSSFTVSGSSGTCAPTRTPLPTSNTLCCLLPNHPWPAHPRASQPCHTSPMPEVSNCPWHASMQSMKEETAAPSILSATLLTASLSFIRELRKPCKCWLEPFSLPKDSNDPAGRHQETGIAYQVPLLDVRTSLTVVTRFT